MANTPWQETAHSRYRSSIVRELAERKERDRWIEEIKIIVKGPSFRCRSDLGTML